MKYDYSISVVRNLALFIVLVLHVRQSVGLDTAGLPWQCGVPLFLVISGYLFGQGQISDIFQWYKKRLIRIWIPFLLLYVVNLSVYLLTGGGKYEWIELIQGMLALPAFNFNVIGMQHCWYLTYLLVCYFIVPLLHKCFGSGHPYLRIGFLILSVITLSQLSAFVPFIGKYSFIHVLLFIVSFCVGKAIKPRGFIKSHLTSIAFGGVLSILSYIIMTLSISLSAFFVLVYYSFLSLLIFSTIMLLLDKVSWERIIGTNSARVIQKFDYYSFYIYLCHYWFTKMSWWSVFDGGLTMESILQYVLFILIATSLFSLISEKLINFIKYRLR